METMAVSKLTNKGATIPTNSIGDKEDTTPLSPAAKLMKRAELPDSAEIMCRINRAGDATLVQNLKIPLVTSGLGVAVGCIPVVTFICAPLLWLIGSILFISGLCNALVVVAPNASKKVVSTQAQAHIPPGTIRDLVRTATRGFQSLALKVGETLREKLHQTHRDISGDVENHLKQLQGELVQWIHSNENLRTYSDGEIGWLAREKAKEVGEIADLTSEFHDRMRSLPATGTPLTPAALDALPLPPGLHWDDFIFLLVPGLLTKWYPLYMAQLKHDLKRLGLLYSFSRVDTDQSVRVNAGQLRDEVLDLAEATHKRVVLFGHSKAAVDITAAMSLYPELGPKVAAVVSLQGPHGGVAIVNDLLKTSFQKRFALGALSQFLRGSKHALLDLSYAARRHFWEAHSYPSAEVATICLATSECRTWTLLKPLVDYIRLRYGEPSDGLVCLRDALLPGAPAVYLHDMDHFGPAWGSFPATDPYDPARLCLCLLALALHHHHPPTPSALRPPPHPHHANQ